MKHRFLRPLVAVTVAVGLSGFTVLETLFSPRADLWPKWEAHDPTSTQTIDHRAWGNFLKTYVKRSGDGEMISLNDIEHRILRPVWRDPRLHYAVNHASVGCPNLAAKPCMATAINAMLHQAASAYIKSPQGVLHSPDGLVLSKIYAWFAEDFGGSETMVLDHIARHASSDTEVTIMKSVNIAAYKYDWSLNETMR